MWFGIVITRCYPIAYAIRVKASRNRCTCHIVKSIPQEDSLLLAVIVKLNGLRPRPDNVPVPLHFNSLSTLQAADRQCLNLGYADSGFFVL